MRRHRDIDAELTAHADKARGLRAERILQLGSWSRFRARTRSTWKRWPVRY